MTFELRSLEITMMYHYITTTFYHDIYRNILPSQKITPLPWIYHCEFLESIELSSSLKEHYLHYGRKLKIKTGKFSKKNHIPYNTEDKPATQEWSSLTPSVPSTPVLATFVENLNNECPLPKVHTPPPSPTIGETLQVLNELEARSHSLARSPLPVINTPPRSPFEEPKDQRHKSSAKNPGSWCSDQMYPGGHSRVGFGFIQVLCQETHLQASRDQGGHLQG